MLLTSRDLSASDNTLFQKVVTYVVDLKIFLSVRVKLTHFTVHHNQLQIHCRVKLACISCWRPSQTLDEQSAKLYSEGNGEK